MPGPTAGRTDLSQPRGRRRAEYGRSGRSPARATRMRAFEMLGLIVPFYLLAVRRGQSDGRPAAWGRGAMNGSTTGFHTSSSTPLRTAPRRAEVDAAGAAGTVPSAQQRPGHPRHRAPGGRRQPGPGRARADDRGQDPHRPCHVRDRPRHWWSRHCSSSSPQKPHEMQAASRFGSKIPLVPTGSPGCRARPRDRRPS